MKRSYLALAIAGAALVISASGPAYAAPPDDNVASDGATVEWMLANRDSGIDFAKIRRVEAMRNVLAVPAAESTDINRVTAFAPAPRLTYAVLVTTASPQALAFGSNRAGWSIA